jgi:hypothetical protein
VSALNAGDQPLLGHCVSEDRFAVLRLQVAVGKAQDLKTAAITDDPENSTRVLSRERQEL